MAGVASVTAERHYVAVFTHFTEVASAVVLAVLGGGERAGVNATFVYFKQVKTDTGNLLYRRQ